MGQRVPDVSQPGPEETLSAREEQAALRRAVTALPEDYRDVVILHVYGEIPLKEISAMKASRRAGPRSPLPGQTDVKTGIGGTAMKNRCDIVQDLLPLYVDGCCHPGSRELVEEHLQECPACKQTWQEMTGELPVPQEPQPEGEEQSAPEEPEQTRRSIFARG